MKWVKASGQLPYKKDRYFVKLDSRSKELIYFNGNRFETYEWITHDHIEWLYEDDKPLLQIIKELENTIYHERANNEQTLLVLSRKDAEIEALKERVSFLEGLAKKMFL